jgi:hypothetical protein
MTPVERLRRIEGKRERLLVGLATLPLRVLEAHPLPGKWSIAEIIEHLVISEEGVIGDFARLADREALPRSTKNRMLYIAVMGVLRFDIPVQVPSRGMNPVGGRSLAQLSAAWELNHTRLRAFVDTVDPARLRDAIFRHPVAGPLTLGQGLLMLETHLDRHIRQIRRLERLT